MQNPLMQRLGYPPDARLVIFHADDVGMCHGSNQAFVDLAKAGIVCTGSLMTPCPWAPEMFAQARLDPSLDLGVHLTLTSEWARYRWGPLSTRDPASGLLDGAGYFWPRVHQLEAHLNVAAAVAEMEAQIATFYTAGVDFTHLDTHMGAALTPLLLEHYIRLGFKHQTPVLLPRQIDDYIRSLGLSLPDPDAYQALVADIEARGMPLVDWFRITPGYDIEGGEGGRADRYEEILHNLPPGVTYFSLHPNAPGDIEAIVPERAYWRTFEYAYFQSQRLRDFLAAEKIVPITYRALRAVMRSAH